MRPDRALRPVDAVVRSCEDVGVHPDDHRLSLVRALLAKAEASEYPEEAQAFTDKASELIARYAIDDALLWALDRAEDPSELRLVLLAPYLSQKAVLVDAVARAQGCRAVRLGQRPGTGKEQVSVVGYPSDLQWVETLVTSLLLQLTTAMLAGAPKGVSPAASAGWRRSFIVGFADAVRTRLDADRQACARGAATDSSASPAAPSAELVLLERDQIVADEFRRRFPRIRSSWTSSGSSRSGADAGRRAGNEASLARGAVGRTRALGTGS